MARVHMYAYCWAEGGPVTEFAFAQTPLEAEFLAAACLCSSQGHCFVARHMRPKMVEGQGEALFKAYVGFAGGARHVAYDCICWWVLKRENERGSKVFK